MFELIPGGEHLKRLTFNSLIQGNSGKEFGDRISLRLTYNTHIYTA